MNNAKLCYWYFELTLYFLIWNWIELTEQLSSLFIHVQNLSSLCFVSGWYAWWHAQVCWRLWDKPNIYCSKEGKHLEDSETTLKSCLDAVFKLLETSSQTSSQNSLSESVRLLQSQVLAERHSTTQLRLEVLSLRNIAENTNENLIAKQLHLEAMTDMLGRSHSLAQQLAQQFPCKTNLSWTVLEVVSVQYYFVTLQWCPVFVICFFVVLYDHWWRTSMPSGCNIP